MRFECECIDCPVWPCMIISQDMDNPIEHTDLVVCPVDGDPVTFKRLP